MYAGKNLVELAGEVERQAKVKQDYVAPADALRMETVMDEHYDEAAAEYIPTPIGNTLALRGHEAMPMKDIAHAQMAERLGIPKAYYDRMLADDPSLLTENVNTWMARDSRNWMVRTLDGNARALVSDRFDLRLDNKQTLDAIMPTLIEVGKSQGGMTVLSCDITDRKLYMKVVFEDLKAEVRQVLGRGHQSVRLRETRGGMIISNSEVGYGSFKMELITLDSFCTNLAIWPKSSASVQRRHLGSRLKGGHEFLLSEATKQKLDDAWVSETQDICRGLVDGRGFQEVIDMLNGATQERIEGNVEAGVKVLAKTIGLNEREHENTFKNLVEGGDLSMFGLHAAVTAAAEEAKDYDRATELEELGAKVLTLPKAEKHAILNAKK